jgi:hypothetical protein
MMMRIRLEGLLASHYMSGLIDGEDSGGIRAGVSSAIKSLTDVGEYTETRVIYIDSQSSEAAANGIPVEQVTGRWYGCSRC